MRHSRLGNVESHRARQPGQAQLKYAAGPSAQIGQSLIPPRVEQHVAGVIRHPQEGRLAEYAGELADVRGHVGMPLLDRGPVSLLAGLLVRIFGLKSLIPLGDPMLNGLAESDQAVVEVDDFRHEYQCSEFANLHQSHLPAMY